MVQIISKELVLSVYVVMVQGDPMNQIEMSSYVQGYPGGGNTTGFPESVTKESTGAIGVQGESVSMETASSQSR